MINDCCHQLIQTNYSHPISTTFVFEVVNGQDIPTIALLSCPHHHALSTPTALGPRCASGAFRFLRDDEEVKESKTFREGPAMGSDETVQFATVVSPCFTRGFPIAIMATNNWMVLVGTIMATRVPTSDGYHSDT